jgi:prevent-host-death family protein
MITVNTHEAKTRLSALLAAVATKHETVRICNHGKPVADLVPVRLTTWSEPLRPHPELGRILVDYDPTEPLTDEELPEEYR